MEKDDNFQTLNMIYKIEKIKKRKQKKYPKKMDMFETLENPIVNVEHTLPNDIIEPFNQYNSSTKIIEPIINLKDNSNWDMLEPITRKKTTSNKKSFNEDLKKKINDAYNKFTGFNRHLAIFIAIAMSGNLPTEVKSKKDEMIYWGIKKDKHKKGEKKSKSWLDEYNEQVNAINQNVNEIKDEIKKKEGFSWDNDDKGESSVHSINNTLLSSKDNNIDYKTQEEVEVNAKSKVDVFSKTGEYAKNAVNKLLSGDATDSGATPADIDLIQKYIGWFEAVMLASYSVYNWYYLMFSLERGRGNNDGDYDVRYRPTRKFLEDIYNERVPPHWIGTTGAYILLFLFEFPLFFPEAMDKFLFDVVPKYSRSVLNGAFCFIILFYLLSYMYINYLYQFKEFFIDYLDGKLTNPIFGLILAVMIVLYIISLGSFSKAGASKINDLLNQKPPTTISDMIALEQAKMMDEANKIANSAKKFNLFTIANFILFDTILRLICVITIGVPVAAFFIAIYILVYSLFGIFIYQSVFKGGDSGFWKDNNRTTFDFIAEHIKKNNGLDKYEEEPSTYMEYFYNVITLMNKFSLIVYDKIFTIGYLIVLSLAGIDFLNLSNIKSVLPVKNLKMKELLIVFILILLVAVASYAYNTTNVDNIKDILLASGGPEEFNNTSDNDYKKFIDKQKNIQIQKTAEKAAYVLERQRIEREENPNLNLLGFRTNVNKPSGQKLFGVGTELNPETIKQNTDALVSGLTKNPVELAAGN